MDRELDPDIRRRRLLKGWLRAAAAVAVAVVALVWLAGMLKPALKRQRIRTARVERGTLEAVITAAGTVVPATEKVISSPVEARVIRVLHPPGTALEAGQAILELDVSQSRLELASLDEKIEQAGNRRRELELERQESLIDLESRRQLKALDVEQLVYHVEQTRQLFDQGLTSEAALREAETRLKKARIEHRTLVESIDNAGQTATAQIARLDSELRALARERDEARRRLELATPRAERPGVLTWVAEEEGATVHAGEAIARVADLESFRVDATVSDIHAARLGEGLKVRVPVGDEVLDGRIRRVLPAIESGTASFRVELDEPGHPLLRSNLRVDVLVVTEEKKDVLMVKKGPFVDSAGWQDVFVVEDGVARRRRVRLGLSGYERYEVAEGLAEGDEIVVSDTSHVIDLAEVAIR